MLYTALILLFFSFLSTPSLWVVGELLEASVAPPPFASSGFRFSTLRHRQTNLSFVSLIPSASWTGLLDWTGFGTLYVTSPVASHYSYRFGSGVQLWWAVWGLILKLRTIFGDARSSTSLTLSAFQQKLSTRFPDTIGRQSFNNNIAQAQKQEYTGMLQRG